MVRLVPSPPPGTSGPAGTVRRPLRGALLAGVLCGVGLTSCEREPPQENVAPFRASTGGTSGTSASGGGAGAGAVGGTGAGGTGAAAGAGASGGDGGGGDAGDASADVPGDTGFVVPSEPFSKQALLRQIGDCALRHARRFETRALDLRARADEHGAAPDGESQRRVQAAWRAAIAEWQESEPMQFGPAARGRAPGARNLRDAIYAWPLGSRCKVEEQLVAGTDGTPGFGTSLLSGRTLTAVEYLAFHEGVDNACTPFSSINATGSWAALGPERLRTRKAEYARAAAREVAVAASLLVEAWDPARGNFHRELHLAGAGSAVFATQQAALNAVSDALFYVEHELKDLKLARPAGLLECFAPICPEALESQFARVSTVHVAGNLRGFRRLFQGCGDDGSGLGFDDWLTAVGAADLARRMLEALDGAERAVATLAPPLEEALVTDVSRVIAVHAAIKRLTDLLKTEFVTVLDLELPASVEGDND